MVANIKAPPPNIKEFRAEKVHKSFQEQFCMILKLSITN